LVSLRANCVAFSPDGQVLASGYSGIVDAKIRLWDIGRRKLRGHLSGHGWESRTIAFSPDGNFLVSGGVDGAIMIWDWRSGERLHTLNRPTDLVGSLVSWFDSSVGSICCVALSPDGETIASAGSNQPVMLWDFNKSKPKATAKLLRTFTEHSGWVYCVAFSPDGKILASGGDDNTVRIWDFNTAKQLNQLKHLGPIHSVTFSSDGKTLVSSSEDTTIKVWTKST
jgi:WD40 repeat protein